MMRCRLCFVIAIMVGGAAMALPMWAKQEGAGRQDATLQSTDDRATLAVDNARELYQRIILGKASYQDIRQALSTPNVGELINFIHALYNMRWHRGTHSVLQAIWRGSDEDRARYPDLAWDRLDKPVVRIAVASTLNRFYPMKPEFRAFLRAHINDSQDLRRAQAAVGLGLNADPADVDSIVGLVDADTELVVQSAVTALGLMKEERARKALETLLKQHEHTAEGDLIRQVLGHFYESPKPVR